jgi:hypothetical protein
MTRITTECPECGRVELGSDDITLVVSPRQGTAWYLFDCLGCTRQVVAGASSAVVTALARLQIPIWILPSEMLERRGAEEGGRPLAVDDLLDLMLSLRTDDDLAALAETGVRPSDPSPTPAS